MSVFQHVDTIPATDCTDPENAGVVLVSVFERRLVKVLVTRERGADADLLLVRGEVERLIAALQAGLAQLD